MVCGVVVLKVFDEGLSSSLIVIEGEERIFLFAFFSIIVVSFQGVFSSYNTIVSHLFLIVKLKS